MARGQCGYDRGMAIGVHYLYILIDDRLTREQGDVYGNASLYGGDTRHRGSDIPVQVHGDITAYLDEGWDRGG